MALPVPPAAAPDAQPADAQGPGPLTQLAMAAHDSMMKLADALAKDESVDPKIAQKLGAIIGAFEDLAQEAVSGAPADDEGQEPIQGNVPVEAGNRKVQPVL